MAQTLGACCWIGLALLACGEASDRGLPEGAPLAAAGTASQAAGAASDVPGTAGAASEPEGDTAAAGSTSGAVPADTGSATSGSAGSAGSVGRAGSAGSGGGGDAADAAWLAQVNAAQARWLDAAPSRYVLKTCGTGFAQPGCTIDAVEDGHVVAGLLEGPAGEWAPYEPNPDEPFASTFESLRDTSCSPSAQYDERWGYPKETFYSCGSEGWGMRVSCFVPDSSDLQACVTESAP